ncbi:MAG TPA: hypothetical protein VFJ43_17410, partial [Bacteroidia bacterium]|nr:hypothetical protein [Bacteroidia bacterium]
ENSVGAGRDSAMFAATMNFPDNKKVFTYVGNGNKVEVHSDGKFIFRSILFLADENKTYIIWPSFDTITYYDDGIPEKGKTVEFKQLDSTENILGYKCNIFKSSEKQENYYWTNIKYYYVNNACALDPSLTENAKNDYANLTDSTLKAYPLKIVSTNPGDPIITTIAIKIKPMNTDTIFERYRMMIKNHPLKKAK